MDLKNELRIGNYIINRFKKSNGFPEYIDKVTALATYGECTIWSEPIDKETGGSKCLLPGPIPLDVEWLSRFGYSKPGTKKDVLFDGTLYFERIEDAIFLCLKGDKRIIEIEFVHEYQSLFFDLVTKLTGEELKLLS